MAPLHHMSLVRSQKQGLTLPTEPRSPRLAVLIDADNTSAKIADGLFEEIAKIGEASVRRIYGDFSSTRSKAWADVLSKHAIIPQQQFAYTTGKNASDITLVIDAMDLLHSGRFEGFCLVSSDAISPALPLASGSTGSTFMGLASRRRRRVSGRHAAGSYTPRTCCRLRQPTRTMRRRRSPCSRPAPRRRSSPGSFHRWEPRTAGCRSALSAISSPIWHRTSIPEPSAFAS